VKRTRGNEPSYPNRGIGITQPREGSVSEENNQKVVERYVRAVLENDFETQERVLHADYIAEWPQSGERIRGRANVRAIGTNYPGGAVKADVKAVRGAEDRWVTTPVGTLLRVIGTGDVYTALFTATYPGDPRPWHCAAVVELRDGKVLKSTVIFGAPFDAPAWRARWVERM